MVLWKYTRNMKLNGGGEAVGGCFQKLDLSRAVQMSCGTCLGEQVENAVLESRQRKNLAQKSWIITTYDFIEENQNKSVITEIYFAR